MRAYLAVLRDSFHEALASRVLWILLILITLFLLGLAPLGVTEQAGSYLQFSDFTNREGLAAKVAAAGAAREPSPGKRVWQLLSVDLQTRLADRSKQTDDGSAWMVTRQLREDLNGIIERRDFFDAPSWSKVDIGYEARNLLETGLDQLPADQVARFNRLVLQAAFPDDLAPIRRKQVQLSYFQRPLGIPLPLDLEQFHPTINRILLAVMAYLLGVLGVLIAVLVTASIMPQTFEPGSIDLLLSKPISRVLLYLTKFAGGCAFIAINASYFIVGLWLILGWRFGLWNQKLLLCIPIYLFLFAIYYSVSALVGLIWRNAVVSIVMTIVFWAVCWGVGLAKNGTELLAINPQRLVRLVPAEQALFARDEQNNVELWEKEAGGWQAAFIEAGPNRSRFMPGNAMIGPIYDPSEHRLLAIGPRSGGFGGFGAGANLLIGKESQGWKRLETVPAPDGTTAMFINPSHEIIAVSSRGIYRLEGNPEIKPERLNIFGLQLPLDAKGGKFVSVGPKLSLNNPLSAAMDARSGAIAIYDANELSIFDRDDQGRYARRMQISRSEQPSGVLALSGDTLWLALSNGEVRLYDPKQLALLKSFQPAGADAPRLAEASADGRWVVVVFHNRELWLYDARRGEPASINVAGQGDISTASFDSAGRLLVADRLGRVSRYHLDPFQIEEQLVPPMELAETIYRYLIVPIYTVFPKPGQLDQTVNYLLTDEQTVPRGPQADLSASRIKLDVWGPVWSNLAFLTVMLALAAIYIHRRDF